MTRAKLVSKSLTIAWWQARCYPFRLFAPVVGAIFVAIVGESVWGAEPSSASA